MKSNSRLHLIAAALLCLAGHLLVVAPIQAWADVICSTDHSFASKVSKLLEEYAPFDYAQNPRTIGIEIEGLIPDKVTHSSVAQAFLERIQSRYPDVRPTLEHKYEIPDRPFIEITYKRDGKEYKWQIKDDHSVEPANRMHKDTTQSIEIVSPILRTADDFALFFDATKDLVSKKFIPELSTAGVHVHIGFPNPNAAELRVLDAVFRRIERSLLKEFRTTPSRQEFAVPLEKASPVLDPAIEMNSPKTADRLVDKAVEYGEWQKELRKLNENIDILDAREIARRKILMENIRDIQASMESTGKLRYRALNYLALADHGTVEFRLYNSTLDAKSLKFMVDLSASIIEKVRTKDPVFFQYLFKTDSNKINVIELAEALGLANTPSQRKEIEVVLHSIAEDVRRYYRENRAYIKNAEKWVTILGVALFIDIYANPGPSSDAEHLP